MESSQRADLDRLAPTGPVPDDVRKAVELMRKALCRPLSISDLCRHCGVAERTLNEHFRAFMGISPIKYLHRLRLAAAREALLAGDPSASVTEIATRYFFNHCGRFSKQYRARFGEVPSATLHRARAAARLRSGELKEDIKTPCPARGSREKPSIAIVLGAVSSNDPSLRWFAEAVAEAIAANLCSLRSLTIMLPGSAFAALRNPQRLARDLGARYFLTGRTVLDGKRLRFILGLVEVATGYHVWGDNFDGEIDCKLSLQDRIVQGVRQGVVPGVCSAEIDRATRLAPRDLDAHGLAMRALPLLYCSTPDAAHRALEILNRTIEIDPDYGLATALAAWGHAQLVQYHGTTVPSEERDLSQRLARRAAILEGDDPLALTARSAVHMMLGEFGTSEELITQALARDPTSGWAWGRSGWLHSYRGDSETAIAHFRCALRLGPISSRENVFVGIGCAHFNGGRYAAAASCIRQALCLRPSLTWANRSLSVSYARLGERTKARESLDALRQLQPDLTVSQVLASVPFRPSFLNRLAEGLTALGLPP